MHGRRFAGACCVLVAILSVPALSQSSRPDPSINIRSDFPVKRLAEAIEQRDGILNDPSLSAYIQAIANQLARAAGRRTPDVRITRGSVRYAYLAPNHVLYISGGLWERVASESELVGLLAHQLAHTLAGPRPAQPQPLCALAFRDRLDTWGEARRESERSATRSALETLKTAGYDPSAVLDLLSKLAYENPEWAKAIVAADLIELRVKIEEDVLPPGGYRINSSEFVKQRARISSARQTTR